VVEDTRGILQLLGLDQRRLRLKWISASEGADFAKEIHTFVQVLKELGENPLADPRKPEQANPLVPADAASEKTGQLLTDEQVEYCMECSICTGTCPVSRENPRFAPKQIIKQATMKLDEDLLQSREIWACLSCAHCNTRCPAIIDFPELNRHHRRQARKIGNLPVESHHGIHQLISRLQTHSLQQSRIGWAGETGRFRQSGEHFYFVGCLPYYDVTFRYLNLSPLNSARSVLRLLNRIGIEPVISNDERCCGHDAFWSGDEKTFRELALWNIETIKATGAKTVFFSCPEGYVTFKNYYPKYFGELPFEAVHLTEFLARELPRAGLELQPSAGGAVTYQDPCRLGRWAGIYDSPRQLLNLVPGTELIEMERSRENALCCGTTAWMECSRCSKAIQTERLLEAAQTGAKELITVCPKCQMHLTCAQSGENIGIRVQDLYTYLAERMGD